MKPALRPTEEADLDFVVALEAGPEAAPFVKAWPVARHRTALGDPDIAHLLIVDGGEPAGFVILAGVDDPDDNIELRRVVVAHPGRGLGRAALTLVLDHAFDQLAAHRVWLDVKPANARARHLYRSLGFVEEGILHDALRTADGRYESLILMAKLAPNPTPP
ncbi:MAG TPA: GNAT family protein [Solirubrobacterales bacterium]|nr:GNAT family protein [Solirubrobacterales bacterium]